MIPLPETQFASTMFLSVLGLRGGPEGPTGDLVTLEIDLES